MQRATNLFERIPDPDNLRLAFHKAARGRRGQAAVRQFAAELDRHIVAMSEGIRAGTFPVGRFQQFLIRDPKERVITAPCFDERVLHHAIMNVCEPVSRESLVEARARCQDFAATHLALEFKPGEIRRSSGGVSFLGCRISRPCETNSPGVPGEVTDT